MDGSTELPIGIVTDSACDLPAELVEELQIEVVPLTVHFGTDLYQDGELSMEEFWARAAGPHPPQTSQPPVGAFLAAYERWAGLGRRVLCLTITGKHSGTCNAARLAAQPFGEGVKVFDTLSLSLGQGLQALAAAQAARAGQPMEAILAMLEGLRSRMRLLIVLDTLENLRRGGRADAFIGIADRMARALNLKVLINVVEGQLRLLGAARSFKSVLRRVLATVEQMGPLDQLAVLHTRSQDVAEQVAAELAQRLGFPRDKIWVRETGTVLASHAGPRVIAVLAVPKA